MMWLLLDIGNSATKAALHDGVRVLRRSRFETVDPDREASFTEWMGLGRIERAGAVSVVPGANTGWNGMVERRYGASVEFFDHTSRLPFDMVYDTPETLGNDRIAAAAGAQGLHGRLPDRAIIAVDIGTAVTYEVVTTDGRYLAGPIAPGPELVRRAIHAGTAQLPLVDLEMPARLTGAGTERSIQAGIMAGFVDSVRGMLDRLVADFGDDAHVVLTGGWADWLGRRIGRDVTIEPDLVLLGVRELMESA